MHSFVVLQESTLKNVLMSLSDVPTYLAALPNITQNYSDTHKEDLSKWYADLIQKLHHKAKQVATSRAPTTTVSLHTVWEATRQEWTDLQAEVGLLTLLGSRLK